MTSAVKTMMKLQFEMENYRTLNPNNAVATDRQFCAYVLKTFRHFNYIFAFGELAIG